MLCGEIQKIDITLKNVGNSPLSNIYLASSDAKLFSLGDEGTIQLLLYLIIEID